MDELKYTAEEFFSVENEIAVEYGIPTTKDDEIFANYAIESGDFESAFEFTSEATSKKMSKEECMKAAKKKALEKFKKGKKYKKVTNGMSNAEKNRLDRELQRAMNNKEHEADSVWVRHPYGMTFLCLFFLGVLGAFIAVYYLDKYSAARRRYND